MEDSDATLGATIASERGAARAAGRDRARRAADMAEAEAEKASCKGKHEQHQRASENRGG